MRPRAFPHGSNQPICEVLRQSKRKKRARATACPIDQSGAPIMRASRDTAYIGFEAENKHSNFPIVAELAAGVSRPCQKTGCPQH